MNKYWAIVWSMIEQADVVLEVVDARYPSICRSNVLESRVKEMDDTALMIALNKSDLVPRTHLNEWIRWLDENEGIKSLGVSATQRLGTSLIQKELLRASSKKKVKVAVVGLPNTGKSSLINRLRGKKAASTAPVAGWTKGPQIVNVSNSITMFDTPGVIPIKLPEKHRFLLGIIPITKLKDPIFAAEELIMQFQEISPGEVYKYYEVPQDISRFFENLALKLNKLLKGGIPNEEAAAIVLLRDHIRGKIPIFEEISNPLRYQH